MKKVLNILSAVDLGILLLWLISFLIARITANSTSANIFAAIFVIIYIIAIVAVIAFTVASAILLIKKKPCSKPLVIAAYIADTAWIILLAAVIKNALF